MYSTVLWDSPDPNDIGKWELWTADMGYDEYARMLLTKGVPDDCWMVNWEPLSSYCFCGVHA